MAGAPGGRHARPSPRRGASAGPVAGSSRGGAVRADCAGAEPWLQGIWSESKSAAEIQATESRFGQLLVCPVSVQYLHAESYRAPDRKPATTKREDSDGARYGSISTAKGLPTS